MTENTKQAIGKFREKFVEAEGFGGIGGAGTRNVFTWPDNPDFSDEILIDDIEQFLTQELEAAEQRGRENNKDLAEVKEVIGTLVSLFDNLFDRLEAIEKYLGKGTK